MEIDINSQLVWQDRFNIGVDYIDKEHQKLFGIMNKLIVFSKEENKRQWVCQEGIKYFKSHALNHFLEEENYMESIHYADLAMHKRLHNNFRQNTLPQLEKELQRTGYSKESVNHFLGVCVGWLVGHTLTEDRAMTGEVESKWTNMPPEEEQSVISDVVIGLLYDMFRLDSKLISEHYSAEKFGDGVYYRLVYGDKQGDKWQFFLVFEEKLLLHSIGTILNIKASKANTMVINATRYTARQFVDRIKSHYPFADSYELQEENLLTHEQLEKAFERRHPQCSLLFDTSEGYFAYCITKPQKHLKNSGMGPCINVDNAMEEIHKYLDHNLDHKNEPPKKGKILVVDDSDVALQFMKELLEKDYDVSVAKSGLSAIRCITLDRPNLVLLDYEMPVCDGSQVLEMIRSEEDFADIPVIFLTSTVDKERINKIIPLKPNGYLLKNAKPTDLKKNIDDYFKRKIS